MKRAAVVSFLVFLSLPMAGAVAWHHSLSLANGGYWPERLTITVTNESTEPAAGEPVSVKVPGLAGARLESLRVCRADGIELLYDARDSQGHAKHNGQLTEEDRLIVPVECDAHSGATLYVYAGNPQAWAVPDFLPAKLADAAVGPPRRGSRASAGAIEHLQLPPAGAIRKKAGPEWSNWAEVRARSFEDTAGSSRLVRVNLRQALARLPAVPPGSTPCVASSDGAELASYSLGAGHDLLFSAHWRAASEQVFQIGFRPPPTGARAATLRDYERLLASGANLIADGSFEDEIDGDGRWRKPALGGPHQLTARFSGNARFGKRALELNVPENAKADWLGWNSGEIPVKPGATYLLSGWLQGAGLARWATIQAHFHDADGRLTKSGAMVSTQPTVSGNSEWVNSTGFFQAPPDAASIQVHLTMNTTGTLRHDGLVLCEVIDGELERVHSANEIAGRGLQVWEVNPLVKIFPDTPPRAPTRTLRVELARNEFEPIQLAVRCPGATNRLRISVSPLLGPGGAALPPVKIERVGYVPVDYPSAYYTTDVPEWCRKVPRGAGSTDGWAGWWPDPLAPCTDVELGPDQTQPIWLTMHAPKQARPGNYQAQVTFVSGAQKSIKIPLTVRVLPFALPEQGRLRAIFDFRFGPGGGFGSGADSKEHRKQWLRFIAEHRLGIDAIDPPPKFSYKDGKVTMDATAFDEMARFCFDELGMNVAYTPQFFYLFGWAYPPKKFFGLEPFTPEWTSAFQQAYRLFTDHIRQNGWHDRFVYYISDEPHFQHEFVVEQMKKLCALIHEVDPDIPIYSSTWRHCAAWDRSLDLWGIGQYGCFPVADMETLQRAGKQMWFTCDGQMATDTPYLATERLLPYYCFKYGVGGFEFWGLAWWTYNPWQAGWHQFIRQSDEGKKYYWIRYPDGDGYLAYPGAFAGVEGPVSTIRLEQVRQGLEDYEAMALLADLAAKTATAAKAAAAQRALELAKDLVTIPNAGGLRSTEILPDPEQVLRIRKAVNAAITALISDKPEPH